MLCLLYTNMGISHLMIKFMYEERNKHF